MVALLGDVGVVCWLGVRSGERGIFGGMCFCGGGGGGFRIR